MKNIVLILLLIFSINNLECFSPLDSASFEITNIQIAGTTRIGDTIQLNVNFNTIVNDSIFVYLHYSNLVKPLGATGSNNYIMEKIAIDTINPNQLTFNLKCEATGYTDLEVVLFDPKKPEMYSSFQQAKVGLELKPFPEIGNIVYNVVNPIEVYTEYYTQFGVADCDVAISGKVTYLDKDAPGPDIELNGVQQRGAFNKVRVWLHFTNQNTENLYLLAPLDPINGYIEGVHYANCDDQGNYAFNLDNIYLPLTSTPYELIVAVAQENDVIRFTPGSYELTRDSVILGGGNYINIFPSEENKIRLSVEPDPMVPSIFTDMDIIIPSREGSIFRWTAIEQNLILDRFDVSEPELLPFDWERIDVKMVKRETVWYSGCYHSGYNNDIELSDSRPLLTSHEYGHFVDDMMHNHSGCSGNVREGLADFFAGATAAYANGRYGDPPYHRFNWNAGPYDYLTLLHKPSNTFTHNNTRYGNIRPGDINWSAFSCYLGNVYDSNNENPYFLTVNQNKENDDINRQGDRVFEFLFDYISNGRFYFAEYNNYYEIHDAFLDFIDPLREYNELDDACEDLYNFLWGSTNKTHSEQIDNLEVDVSDIPNKITLNWDSRALSLYEYQYTYSDTIHYLNEFAYYKNFEEGYRIYSRPNIYQSWSNPVTTSQNYYDIAC